MKLSNVLFCDDIRHEMNNKLSLMGLYNDRIIFHINPKTEVKWPLPMKLSVLLRFTFDEEDEHPNKFEFKYLTNEKTIIQITGEINKIVSNQSQFNLTLTGEGIPIEIGNLGFSIKLFKDDKLLFSDENTRAIKIIQE